MAAETLDQLLTNVSLFSIANVTSFNQESIDRLPRHPWVSGHPWVGLDIGGANLKAAHSAGWSHSMGFPMWKQSRKLAVSVAQLLDACPAFCGVAVTMTGELADCFATRAEGVAVILEQLTSILPSELVRVYGVDGSWKSVVQSAREPWSVAASNWHGLARFVTRLAGQRSCLLIDVGSTTTDLIPIRNGCIAMEAQTDSQRLQTGALVYTGVERSNVAGIVRELTLFGVPCPVMNEQFATMKDVYLWLRDLPDEPSNCDTADGKPATRESARFRLSRMVGEDGSTLTDSDVDALAREIATAQSAMLVNAIRQLSKGPTTRKSRAKKSALQHCDFECVVISGHGEFLAESALAECGWDGERILLGETLGPELSRCAPAYAIATLAAEEFCVD